MICAGIDAGSRTIKIVLLDENLKTLAAGCGDQGIAQDALAGALLDHLLGQVGADRGDLAGVVATGYGRSLISTAQTTITEITCHARGAAHLMPHCRTVVEIGGQDSKLLHLAADGSVRDFAMNDRCAAGTGRFLEMVATRLSVGLGELGAMAHRSTSPCAISSMCVVFAETEIVGLLASGQSAEDIVAGVQRAICSRVASMASGHVDEPIAFTGGVALVSGMDTALAQALGRPVQIVPQPLYSGALGAAILAMRQSRDRSQ